MSEVPSKTVKSPGHQDVESTFSRVGNESVKRRPPVLRAGDAAVDIIDGRPVPSTRVAVQFEQLVFAGLVPSAGRGHREPATALARVLVSRMRLSLVMG